MAGKNWRDIIADNEKNTRYVIFIFIALYVFIGILGDIVLRSSMAKVNFSQAVSMLVTFQVIPWFTIAMCAVGAISVWLTFGFYDKFMLWGQDYIEIDQEFLSNKPKDEEDIQFWLQATRLYNIIEELKIASRLKYMPKVFIINANFMNAFASGYSEKSAMVAISLGLMNKLNRAEIQAVMAHEISHIKHMDIKLTLFIGVLTNIMLFVVDALANIFYRLPLGDRKEAGNARAIASLILLGLRIFLPIFTVILSMFLSRSREFMADAGAVQLTRDNTSLASALKKIHNDYQNEDYVDEGSKARQAAYIYNPFKSVVAEDFMSTHPSLNNRLKALGFKDEVV